MVLFLNINFNFKLNREIIHLIVIIKKIIKLFKIMLYINTIIIKNKLNKNNMI